MTTTAATFTPAIGDVITYEGGPGGAPNTYQVTALPRPGYCYTWLTRSDGHSFPVRILPGRPWRKATPGEAAAHRATA